MSSARAALLALLLVVTGHCHYEPLGILAWTALDASSVVRAERAAQHVLDTDLLERDAAANAVGAANPGDDKPGEDDADPNADPDAVEDHPEMDPAKDTSHEKKSAVSRLKEFRDHQIATGLSIMFLGIVFLVGFAAWMVAYPDKQVRHYCVRICSSTVVIFMAIAIDHASIFFTLVEAVTGLKGWKLAVAPFGMYWCLTIFVSYKVRSAPLTLAAARNVLSHVSAFVAITGFSDVLYKFKAGRDLEKWQAIACRAGLWLAACLAFWTLRQLSAVLLRRLPYGCEVPEDHGHAGHGHADSSAGHGHSDEHGELEDTPQSVANFIEEVEEALEEASLIALSYLLVKFVIYKTILEIFDLKYLQQTYEQRELYWRIDNEPVVEALLLLVFVVLLLNVAIIGLDRSASFGLHRYHTLSTFLSMCMAWSSMRLIRCLIMVPISEDNCILILGAFALTPMAGVLVIVVDKMADEGLISEPLADSMVTSYGFMIGFSWEKAFAASSNLLIGEYFDGNSTVRPHSPFEFWTGLAVCAALVIVMLPGWRFLILPHALKPVPPRMHGLKETCASLQ